MSSHVDGACGALVRRRQRRLRSMLRHERRSIAMALAEALHHSAGPSKKKVVERRERQEGTRRTLLHRDRRHLLRGRISWRSPAPQGTLEAAARASEVDGLPTFALPVLAGSAGEAVDSSFLRFLTAAALLKKRQQRVQQLEMQEWENRPTRRKGKKRRRKRLPESLLLTVATCSSCGSNSEIWTSFLWFFLVFGVWVLPVEYWINGLLGGGFFDVSVFYAQLGPILVTRTCASLRDIWTVSFSGGILRPLASGSRLFGVQFCRFWGDDFRIRRVQRFLVRQWIHVIASLRSLWVLFPYSAQCLVLSGACYASVTEFAKIHVFTWKSTSDPEVDSRCSSGLFRSCSSSSRSSTSLL